MVQLNLTNDLKNILDHKEDINKQFDSTIHKNEVLKSNLIKALNTIKETQTEAEKSIKIIEKQRKELSN